MEKKVYWIKSEREFKGFHEDEYSLTEEYEYLIDCSFRIEAIINRRYNTDFLAFLLERRLNNRWDIFSNGKLLRVRVHNIDELREFERDLNKEINKIFRNVVPLTKKTIKAWEF